MIAAVLLAVLAVLNLAVVFVALVTGNGFLWFNLAVGVFCGIVAYVIYEDAA